MIKKNVKKKVKKTISSGKISIYASYNNTIVSFTEENGNVLAWATAGSSGFKGARKSTPYAGQIAAQKAAEKAKAFGFNKATVFIKGIGPGREQALRGLLTSGIEIKGVIDITPLAHNGCRLKGRRRV